MAVGANGDVPPTFPVVMDNPGDQAGLMVHELEELQEAQEEYIQTLENLIQIQIQIQRNKLQEELIWHGKLQVGIWLSIMWILISMTISYGFYTYGYTYGFYHCLMDMDTMMMQGPVSNKETESAHIFEELENNVVLANH